MNLKISESIFVVFLSIILIVGVAYATSGTFNPPAGSVPANNYRTLGDIYTKLSDFSQNPSANHSVNTASNPAGTFHTLGEIYALLTDENSDLISSNIRNGVTIFGITGNYTGSGGGGGTTLLWTGTIPSLSFVGGVYTYQPGFGPQHGLCWSHGQYEIGWGCTTGASGGFYEASQGGASIPLGASEYGDYLNPDGTTVSTSPVHYWRLPTQSELYLKMTEAIFSGVDDPVSTSRGGFRNRSYFTSEFNDTNSYINTPVGTYDSVKTVVFLYSSDRKYGSPHLAVREAQSVFRCVHTQ